MVRYNEAGSKIACEKCIKGHRVKTCEHVDEPQVVIRRVGRPKKSKSPEGEAPPPPPPPAVPQPMSQDVRQPSGLASGHGQWPAHQPVVAQPGLASGHGQLPAYQPAVSQPVPLAVQQQPSGMTPDHGQLPGHQPFVSRPQPGFLPPSPPYPPGYVQYGRTVPVHPGPQQTYAGQPPFPPTWDWDATAQYAQEIAQGLWPTPMEGFDGFLF